MTYTIETKREHVILNGRPKVNQDGTLLFLTEDNQVLAVYTPRNYTRCYRSDDRGNAIEQKSLLLSTISK